MLRVARIISCSRSSRNLKKYLLLLCLVSLLGLLLAHKGHLIHRFSRGPYRYVEKVEDNPELSQETDEKNSVDSLEEITINRDLILKINKLANVTTENRKVVKNSQAGFNKQSNVTAKPPVVTTKISKAATRSLALTEKSSNVTTKPLVVTIKTSKITTKLPVVTTKTSKVTIKPQVVKNNVSKVNIEPPVLNIKASEVADKHPVVIANSSKVSTKSPKPLPGPTKAKIIATTVPSLGDEYGFDDIHLNSNCPNRARDKLKTDEFKDIFVETIPVLQWQKHANQSEYRRLQQYAGAQGWMGVTWHILNETLHLLNSSKSGYMFDSWNGSRPCIRCAVVGNGGILNGSGMGAEIDAHDYVFRVNGAITKGFERDVGNRTSFFFFSTNTMMNSLNAYRGSGFEKVPRTKETRYVLLPDHDRDYLVVRAALTNTFIDRGWDKSKYPSKYFGGNLTTEHFKILHPDFMRYLRNRYLWSPILNTIHRNIYRPSTGASMLLTAVHTCDQISAYGFMTPNYSTFSDHYYDKKYHKVVFYSNHNFRKEMALWQKLHKAGVLKLLMRD